MCVGSRHGDRARLSSSKGSLLFSARTVKRSWSAPSRARIWRRMGTAAYGLSTVAGPAGPESQPEGLELIAPPARRRTWSPPRRGAADSAARLMMEEDGAGLATTEKSGLTDSSATYVAPSAPSEMTRNRLLLNSKVQLGVSSLSPELRGVDLGHDLLLQPLEVVERLRHWHVLERRPEKRHRQPDLLVALEVVGDLRGGSREQIAGLALRSLISLLVRDDEPEHVADLETVDRARTPELLELSLDGAAPLLELVRRVLDPDPARQGILRDAVCRALRVLEPAEEDRRVRLLDRLRAEPASVEVGELAVVLEEVVRPDALHDLDRLAHVPVPLGEDVRGARRREFLGHPAGPHAHVDPAVGEMVHGGDLRSEDAGRAEWRIGDAHANPHLRRLRGEPRDQRHALEPLAAGGHRQCLRELVHHAKRVLELLTIGGFRDDDPVECPDGVVVELLGKAGKLFELLDGHLVSKVWKVQSELHER